LEGSVGHSALRWWTGAGFAVAAVAVFFFFRHAGIAVLSLVIFGYMAALMAAIAFLLDYPPLPRRPRISKQAAELAQRNLLVAVPYTADRAFRVDESSDEDGPHYFLELEDGSVLHLCGTYLFDYEPAEHMPRHFPCTQFAVRRHAESGEVVDLLCGGTVIEPEIEAPPFHVRDFQRGKVPCDGEVLREVSFDELLLRCAPRRLRLS
jgi:hypothetical protein